MGYDKGVPQFCDRNSEVILSASMNLSRLETKTALTQSENTSRTNIMNKWPGRIPEDLRQRWHELEIRPHKVTDQVRWGEVVDWLTAHSVTPPGHDLPTESEEEHSESRYG